MKTRPVFWYKNLFRFLIVLVVSFVAVFVMTLGMSWALFNSPEYWTKTVDSVFGPGKLWILFPTIISGMVCWFIALALWQSQFKISIFDYEKKKGLVPYVHGLAVALPYKKETYKIDWHVNKVFDATLKIKEPIDSRLFWAEDDNGIYLVPTNVLAKHADKIKDGCIEGKWTWRWFGDFVILVYVEE